MRARDIMTTDVITVPPDASVVKIAGLMRDHRISGIPVVDEQSKVVGIVSEGDLMRRLRDDKEHRSWWLSLFHSEYDSAADFAKARGQHARDVATRNVVSVEEDASISDIARTLETHQIKRVLVMRDDRLVGLVSRGDLLRGLATSELQSEPVAKDDQQLREAVSEALKEVPGLQTAYVGVNVKDGVAQIWGIAGSDDHSRAARVAAENVPGIKEANVRLGQVPPWIWGQ
mgnify:CR=1 FL=1